VDGCPSQWVDVDISTVAPYQKAIMDITITEQDYLL